MPELMNLEVTPGEIVKGDIIDGVRTNADMEHAKVTIVKSGKTIVSNGHTVENVDSRGPVNVKLQTTGGTIVLERTSLKLVDIRRIVKTDEDKQAEMEEHLEVLKEMCEKDMRKTADSDPLATFNDKMAGYTNDIASGASWYVSDLLEGGIRKQIAQRFINLLEREEHPFTIIKAARLLKKQAARDLMSIARSGGGSRSTSQVSNLAEDIKMKVLAELMEDGMAWGTMNRMLWTADRLGVDLLEEEDKD